MLIAGDVYRPAAIDQLVILGEQVLDFESFESSCVLRKTAKENLYMNM